MSQGHIQHLEEQLRQLKPKLEKIEAMERDLEAERNSVVDEHLALQQIKNRNDSQERRYSQLNDMLTRFGHASESIQRKKDKIFQEEEQINIQIEKIQEQAEKLRQRRMETDLAYRDKTIIDKFLVENDYRSINHNRGYEKPRARQFISNKSGPSYLLGTPLFSALREIVITNLPFTRRQYLENQVIPALIRARPNDLEDRDTLVLALLSGNLGIIKSLFNAGLNPNLLFESGAGTHDESIALIIKSAGLRDMPRDLQSDDSRGGARNISILELAKKLQTLDPKFYACFRTLSSEAYRRPEEGDTPLMIALKIHDIDALEKLVLNPMVNVLQTNSNNVDTSLIAKRIFPDFYLQGSGPGTLIPENELYKILSENLIKDDPELERFYHHLLEENSGNRQKANKLFVLKARPEVERLYEVLSKIDRRVRNIVKREMAEYGMGLAAIREPELPPEVSVSAPELPPEVPVSARADVSKATEHLQKTKSPLTAEVKQRVKASRQAADFSRAQEQIGTKKEKVFGYRRLTVKKQASAESNAPESAVVMTIDDSIGMSLCGVPKTLFAELQQRDVERYKQSAAHSVLKGTVRQLSPNAYSLTPKTGNDIISVQHYRTKKEIVFSAVNSKGGIDLKRTLGAGFFALKEHYLDNPNVQPITLVANSPEILKNVVRAFQELGMVDSLSKRHETPMLKIKIESQYKGDREKMLKIADSIDLGVVNREEISQRPKRRT